MPEPHEREIETLLKDAAARRREEAGSPEMHPSVREMLRTEIRRQYRPVRAARPRRTAWWLRLLPRLAVFALLAVAAWQLIDHKEDPSELRFAEGNRPSAPTPAGVGQASPGEAMTGADKADERGPGSIHDAVLPPPAAFAPVAAAEPMPDSLTGKATQGGSVVGSDYFKSDRQAMYMGTAVAKQEQQTLQNAQTSSAYAGLMSSDESPASATRMRMPAASSLASQVPLSQRFTVVNEGQSLRLIDADGSAYRGTLEVVQARPATAVGASESAAPTPMSMAPTPSSVNGPANGYQLVNYRVTALGTNRTLGQKVRFEGNLALTKQQMELGRNVFSNTIVPVAGDRLRVVPARESPEIPGRLRGRVTVEDGADVPVDAVPTR